MYMYLSALKLKVVVQVLVFGPKTGIHTLYRDGAESNMKHLASTLVSP